MTSVVIRHSVGSGITEVVIDGVKQEQVIGVAFYRTTHARHMLLKVVYSDSTCSDKIIAFTNPRLTVEYTP